MSTPQTLSLGDCTYSTTFNKLSRGENGNYLQVSFKPPKGQEFISMVIGTVPAKTVDYDLAKMLKRNVGLFHVTEVEELLVKFAQQLNPELREGTTRIAVQTLLQTEIDNAKE